MDGPARGRAPLRAALALVGVLVVVLGFLEVALALDAPDTAWSAAAFVVVGVLYAGCGLVAWSRRPSNRMGLLIVLGGVAIMAAALASTADPVLVALGTVVATLPFASVVHLVHAFPSGRLRSVPSRVLVVACYLVSLVLQVPLWAFSAAPPPGDLLLVADRPDLAALGAAVQSAAGASVLLATAVLLAGRLRRATPAQRRVLVPLYAYGVLAVPLLPVLAVVVGPLTGMSLEVVGLLQLIVVAGVPVAFTLAVLRGGFARTAELEELGAWLAADEVGRPELTAALARTLGDDTVQLVFRVHGSGDHADHVDAEGRPVVVPPVGHGRAAAEVELAGRPVGAVLYNALVADPDDVRSAAQVVAIAVDHERLTAELRASRTALDESRARIVAAGDRERRRIAQDLHDGLQVRLVVLAMEAQMVAGEAGACPAVAEAASGLRRGIDEAAAELRALVHAVMPAALVQRGLAAATEDLVDRVALPVHLESSVVDGVLPAVVESTAYFVVAEALANALKHADATRLCVRLVADVDELTVEVRDDGVGGVVLGAGTGLRGLADRVDAAGGALHVESPPGGGTRIRAVLPCAS
ncbi:histidine kinase [Actinomycetospora straminea]|uniref:histidine kinase n=1 Tax=Actinomycetospora straminea TaxID=663607 RepID=A0ABP9E9W4_9PSEU|nr:histidine kinase [Actinomycetospora straminea]MDD7934592.1 histidine kinase [Actinomycetospora straminea]